MAANQDSKAQEQASAQKTYKKWLTDIFKPKGAAEGAPDKNEEQKSKSKPRAPQNLAADARLRIVGQEQRVQSAPARQTAAIASKSGAAFDEKIMPGPAAQGMQGQLLPKNPGLSGSALTLGALSDGFGGSHNQDLLLHHEMPQDFALLHAGIFKDDVPYAIEDLDALVQGSPQAQTMADPYLQSKFQENAEALPAFEDAKADLTHPSGKTLDNQVHTVITHGPSNAAQIVQKEDELHNASCKPPKVPKDQSPSWAQEHNKDSGILHQARPGAFYVPPKKAGADHALQGLKDDARPATVISRTGQPAPFLQEPYKRSEAPSVPSVYRQAQAHSHATKIEDHTGGPLQQDKLQEIILSENAAPSAPKNHEAADGQEHKDDAKAQAQGKVVPVNFMMLGENFCITCQKDDEALMHRAIAKIEELAASTSKANPAFSPLQSMIIAALRLEFDHQKTGAAPKTDDEDLQEVARELDDLTKLASKIQDECKPLC